MSATGPTTARPTGITILAVLSAIGGVLGLLGGIAAVGIGGLAAASTGAAAFFGLGAVVGLILIATAVASLVFAYGAWNMLPWAWPLGVAIQIISLVLAALAIISSGDISGQIIGIVISAVILYYLFQPSIKAAFGRA
jgi:hypothetical protein